jgi:RNA polymerase-binding transcription factor DksA
MDPRRQTHFRELLTTERKRVVEELRRIAIATSVDERDALEPGVEPEPGPSGSTFEDDAAIATHESVAISNIDRALRLLEEEPNRYGVCITCGRRIGMARLEAVPTTRYCQRHASK